MPLLQGPRFYIPFESTCCLLLSTAISSVTGNHTMDLLYLLKDNFKNLFFDLLISGRSFENLSYLSSCSLSKRWRFGRTSSSVLRGIVSDLTYTKVKEVTFQYILRSEGLRDPLSSNMLKKKRIILLVNSELSFSV